MTKKLNFCAQQSHFTNAASIPGNAQLAPYKVVYRAAQREDAHTITEQLMLPAAIDAVSTMADEASANKLKAIPLANNTTART